MIVLQALMIFGLMCIVDICWAFYTSSITNKLAFKASAWSAVVYIIGVTSTINVIHNPWMLIPAALGCFVGTYIAVKFEQKKASQQKVETLV